MSYHPPFTSFYQRKSFAKLLETPLGAELYLKWHWSGINNCEIFHMQPPYKVFDFQRIWLTLTSYVCKFHCLIYILYVIAPDVSERMLPGFYELRQIFGLITGEMPPVFPCSSAKNQAEMQG